ncbi:MAG TPA: macro domain-containing protein [Candidatus Acidoferrales bacterium]|nr:macro domain-containing protein [Candidatus Acidoferrales bacterium]
MRVEIDGKILEAIQGDITDYEGDAVVNAANNYFWMGGGVAGAIKQKGGAVIEQEAMRQGPKPVGRAVMTGAGALNAKYVIHAAVMGQDLQTDSSKIASATRSALELAESNGIISLAFPALGTGVGGFPLSEAAKIMTKEAAVFLMKAKHLEAITFVLYDHEAYESFSNEIQDLSRRDPGKEK